MASNVLRSEYLAAWAACEKMRQERLYAATIARENLLLLMMEERMQRERLEQCFRHEQTLIQLSRAVVTTAPATSSKSNDGRSLQVRTKELDYEEPLPFDVLDQLTEEEVERIWQQEKQRLQHKILSVNSRVQRLRT